MKYEITVIVVVKNNVRNISSCLNSILMQQVNGLEILVIDGGSVDGTINVIKKIARKYPCIRLISEADQGLYYAMNKGLLNALGGYVTFLNSDDYYVDQKYLSKALELVSAKDLDVVFCDVEYVTEESLVFVKYYKSHDSNQILFSNGYCPAHPGLIVDRRLLSGLSIKFDVKYRLGADADWIIKILKSCKRYEYLPTVAIKMRLGGITNKNYVNIIRQNIELLSIYIKHFGFFLGFRYLSRRWVRKIVRHVF